MLAKILIRGCKNSTVKKCCSNMGFIEGRPIVRFRHRVGGGNLMAGGEECFIGSGGMDAPVGWDCYDLMSECSLLFLDDSEWYFRQLIWVDLMLRKELQKSSFEVAMVEKF